MPYITGNLYLLEASVRSLSRPLLVDTIDEGFDPERFDITKYASRPGDRIFLIDNIDGMVDATWRLTESLTTERL